MRLAALLLVATACRSGEGGSRRVTVSTFAGTRAEPGVTVVGHTRDGEVIDLAVADAVGRASVGVDEDSLISVVYPATLTPSTPVLSVVTTVAPEAELSVYGPDTRMPPSLIVGVLDIDGPNLAAADHFDVDVGCVTVRLTRLPDYIDIGSCSLGSDTNLDVLVRAGHGDIVDGYAAGRAAMVNGVAMLDLPTWQTGGTPIPLMLDGVSPIVEWTLLVDGVEFAQDTIVGSAQAYADLAVDETRLRASIASTNAVRITERTVAGVPTAIAFGGDDFLLGVDPTTTLASQQPFGIAWEAPSIGADLVNTRVTWQPSGGTVAVVPEDHVVVWDAVLPPDATNVTLPRLDGDLGVALEGTTDIAPLEILVRHVDSSLHADFAAAQAAGIHAEETRQPSTIVPRVNGAQVRVSQTAGLR